MPIAWPDSTPTSAPLPLPPRNRRAYLNRFANGLFAICIAVAFRLVEREALSGPPVGPNAGPALLPGRGSGSGGIGNSDIGAFFPGGKASSGIPPPPGCCS